MITLKLRIPNSPGVTHRLLSGLLALAVLALMGAGVGTAVAHWDAWAQHYLLWGAVGIFCLLVGTGYVLIFADEFRFQEKGVLLLTDDSIAIDDDDFALTFIQKIAVVVDDQHAQANGPAHRLVLYTASHQKIACHFVFASAEEQELLQQLLQHWHERGVQLELKGISRSRGTRRTWSRRSRNGV